MPERTIDFPLYDTQDFGTSAKAIHTYFQSREGSSSTLTKFLTNMRGDGNLPQQESFVIHMIKVFLDDALVQGDTELWLRDSYIEITVSDKLVFQAPLRLCAAHNAYNGQYSQATAADGAEIGIVGEGYKLTNPIKIEGGVNFRVVIGQGTALATASTGVKVVLQGLLTLPE